MKTIKLMTTVVAVSLLTNFQIAFSQEKTGGYPKMVFNGTKENIALWSESLGPTDTVTYNFKFKNTGGKVLQIKEVDTSCSCTVSEYSKTVKPNEFGYIKMTTIYGDLKRIREVYAVIKANTFEQYHKVELVYREEGE